MRNKIRKNLKVLSQIPKLTLTNTYLIMEQIIRVLAPASSHKCLPDGILMCYLYSASAEHDNKCGYRVNSVEAPTSIADFDPNQYY